MRPFKAVSPLVVALGGAGAAYDTDADAFFTRASITDSTQKSAVNQLVLDLKSAGIWTKLFALYPLVGGTSSTHSHNLKSSSYQITWAGSGTHDANGFTGNGTDAVGDTNLNATSVLTTTSWGFGVYCRINVAQVSTEIAAVTASEFLYINARYTDNRTYWGDTSAGSSFANSNSTGFWILTRTSASSIRFFQGSTLMGSSSVSGGAFPNAKFLLNKNPPEYGSQNIALAFISSGLTDTEVGSLYTAVQAFQTTLGRQI